MAIARLTRSQRYETKLSVEARRCAAELKRERLNRYEQIDKPTSQGDRVSHYTWDAEFQYLFDQKSLLAKVKELSRHLRSEKKFRPGDNIKLVVFTNHPDDNEFSEVVDGKAVGTGFARNQTEMLQEFADKLAEIEMRYEIDPGYHHVEMVEHDVCPQEVLTAVDVRRSQPHYLIGVSQEC